MEETPQYTINNLHYNVTQGHIQDTAPNWNGGVASFPDNTYPEIFQVEMSQEIRTGQKPIFRKFIDHQQPLLFASDKRKAASDWIKTWCDATFMQYASRIWGVTDLNEYFGNGESEHDRQNKIAWADAFAYVWANDWQTQSKLAHIRAVLARTAVGNDIPIEVAQSAQTYNAGLAYHCYWPVRDGVILADSAQWFHQRWQYMDAYYKENGITVPFWVSTEIGAVGYSQSANGDIHLHPNDGWKHPEVYNGNLPAFIDSLKGWSQSVAEWNAQNNNRFLCGNIFTTNREASGWHDYRVTGDELVIIGNEMSQWQPDITPPPVDEDDRLFALANSSQCIAQMPGSALQEYILADNRQMLGNEFNFTRDDNSLWVCRYAGNGNLTPRWVYMFPVGDYRPSSLVIKENGT